MKTKLWVLAAIGASYLAYYLYKKGKTSNVAQEVKENERHHLTKVFSKAKAAAVGN